MKNCFKRVLVLTMIILALPMAAGTRRVVVGVRTVTVPRVVVVTPIHGWVDINSRCKGASVYVNGVLVGKAGAFDGFPAKLKLVPGRYTIKVVEGRKVFRQRVRVF